LSAVAQRAKADATKPSKRRHGFVQVTRTRFGSTISNMRGNSSISAINSASCIGLPLTLILPLSSLAWCEKADYDELTSVLKGSCKTAQ
jgi:hypothetical protein